MEASFGYFLGGITRNLIPNMPAERVIILTSIVGVKFQPKVPPRNESGGARRRDGHSGGGGDKRGTAEAPVDAPRRRAFADDDIQRLRFHCRRGLLQWFCSNGGLVYKKDVARGRLQNKAKSPTLPLCKAEVVLSARPVPFWLSKERGLLA